MKTFKTISASLLMAVIMVLASCSNNPVDRYCDIMNKITAQVEDCKDLADVNQLSSTTLGEDAAKIIQENSDYALTEADKNKLKEVNEKMMWAVFDKTCELSGLTGEIKENSKAQIESSIQAINYHIDTCKTLGDLGKVG